MIKLIFEFGKHAYQQKPIVYTFTTLDFILILISSIISLLVAVYAYKGYILVREKILLYLNLAFTLIGAGLFIEALTIIFAIISRGLITLAIGDYTSMLAQIIGYLLLIYAYYTPTEEEPKTILPALIVLTGIVGYVLNLILIIVVTFIIAKLVVNFLVKRSIYSGFSLASFLLIDLSHIMLAISPYRASFILVSELIRLLGFILLVALLISISRGRT